MNESLNIAIIDDSESDIAIIKIQLKKVYPNATFIATESKAEFEEKIQWMEPDIVLSDYNLPDCNGLDLLLFTKQNYPSVPFVFVTGMLNDEEKTAEVILNGASGYILKQNISNIGPKVVETLHKHRAEKSKTDLIRRKYDEIAFSLDKLKQYIQTNRSAEESLAVLDRIEKDFKEIR